MPKVGFLQVAVFENSFGQVGLAKIGLAEVSLRQVCGAKMTPLKAGLVELEVSQRGVAQVASIEIQRYTLWRQDC